MRWFDQWLEKLPWISVQRHREEVAALSAEHAAQIKTAVRQAKNDSFALGKAEGDAEGYDRGIKTGRLLEREEREEALRIQAEREALRQRKEAEERARWLVSDQPIGFDERIKAEIRRDVKARTGQDPRPRQWDMILSNDPATYVIAGAGSGKSTSLVLRVVALNLYRAISLNRISVFTFTRESRKDFVKKLRQCMGKWGVELSDDEARSVVRTFHSMVLKMARSIDSSLQVLELMDMEKGKAMRDIDIDNLLEVGVGATDAEQEPQHNSEDGGIADTGAARDPKSDAVPERDKFLRLAYERAFMNDPDFAAVIAAIYRYSQLQAKRPKEDATKGLEKNVAEHDAQMSSFVEDAWRSRIAPGVWPPQGVVPVAEPIQLSTSMSRPYRVHGYLPVMEAYVVLGGAKYFPDEADVASKFINGKRKLLAARSDKPIVWIDTVEQLTELTTVLAWYQAYQEKRATVPMFEWRAPGDIGRKPLLRTFFDSAQFVENLGLPVAATMAAALSKDASAALTGPERLLAEAVARFWPVFENVLREHQIWTFNQLFTYFSEDHPEHFKDVDTLVLGAMQHLLIDEFQDISPQIVKWVRGCQRELVKRGLPGSLTCVGDDWQSIYGWRGSSPDFFVRFKEHFPAVTHGCIKLEENFRSSDHILRCAESVLVNVPGMESKTCEAKSRWAGEEMPVLLHEAKGELPYRQLRQLLLAEVERTGATEKEPMLVLSRSGKGHRELSKEKRPAWGKSVKFMTFHAAKGLEARSVVLLEDCVYFGVNPLKNFLYGRAGLGSFDVAQRAEARRLAYVGITRAMERCYWFAVVEKGKDGAFGSVPTGRSFVARCEADGTRRARAPVSLSEFRRQQASNTAGR